MIILDTNVWSALPKAASHARVIDWFSARTEDIWLSVIVIAEIRAGIENPDAAHKRETLIRWLADIELRYAERTLSFDAAAAHIFGRLIAQRRLHKQKTKLLDVQLAAQGLSRDCPVATHNIRDFEWTGVRVIDPWTA